VVEFGCFTDASILSVVKHLLLFRGVVLFTFTSDGESFSAGLALIALTKSAGYAVFDEVRHGTESTFDKCSIFVTVEGHVSG
jgi:hypothetical protein